MVQFPAQRPEVGAPSHTLAAEATSEGAATAASEMIVTVILEITVLVLFRMLLRF